jgi:hypothetical protein
MTEVDTPAQAPNVTEAALLAAFRAATDWTDEQALHYGTCTMCTPICGYEEYDCKDSPARRGEPQAAKPMGEFLHSPFRTQLGPAFRRGA